MRTALVVSRSFWFSVCSSRMWSARMSERPELIIVANWRLKTATSFCLTLPPKGSLTSFFSAEASARSMATGT